MIDHITYDHSVSGRCLERRHIWSRSFDPPENKFSKEAQNKLAPGTSRRAVAARGAAIRRDLASESLSIIIFVICSFRRRDVVTYIVLQKLDGFGGDC